MLISEFITCLELPLEMVQGVSNGCHDFKLSELCKIAEKLDKNLEINLT